MAPLPTLTDAGFCQQVLSPSGDPNPITHRLKRWLGILKQQFGNRLRAAKPSA
jgi:hypothetical protein